MSVQTAGRFTLLRKLPAGGMGRVFEADDPATGRRVALKLIDLGADADSQQIIQAERLGAELQRQLCAQDGRVTQIYEFGEMPGYFYIVMEYVDGEDVSELAKGNGLPIPVATRIAQDVCEVLHRAHHFASTIEGRATRGIVHGDVKPRNIRVTPDGLVKVLDFGIAKALSMTRNFTQNVFASVQYSSPERLRTGEVDVSSDLWGVAAVLYEILAGHPYFDADNGSKLEHTIRNYDRLRAFPLAWPEPLRQVVARALSPDPRIRFHTAAEFAQALQNLQTASGTTDEATRRAPTTADATRRVSQEFDGTVRTHAGSPPSRATVPPESEATRRMSPPPPQYGAPQNGGFRPVPPFGMPMGPKSPMLTTAFPKQRRRSSVGKAVRIVLLALLLLFLVPGYFVAREYMVWRKADQLASDLSSEKQQDLDAAWRLYNQLAASSHLGVSLWSIRDALRNRLMGDADHVIAKYDQSDQSVVTESDWARARGETARALQLEPNDETIHGKLRLVDGHLARIRGSSKRDSRLLEESRQDFEDAANYMKKSPDPWLGLARLYLYSLHDLQHGEAAIREAERRGHDIGKRETAELADGYRYQGERAIDLGDRATPGSDADRYYQLAGRSLDHARELYESILPWAGAAASVKRVDESQARLASRK